MDISLLQVKLPEIREWIDNLLAQHRHAARPVASFGFSRLPEYFAAETLTRAFVVEVDSIPRPPLAALGLRQLADFERMDAAGITYCDTYFIDRARLADESLHFHELVHIVQWHLLGVDRFILAYALGHIFSGGYATNPFEQAAYALEGQFARQEKAFRVEPIVKQHIERIMPALFAGPEGSGS